jgi:outer membrane protein assembly factor BamB
MASRQNDQATLHEPLRLWPGVVAVVLQWLLRYGVPVVAPEAMAIGVFGGLICGLIVIVWWAFFSRAPRSERWLAILLMIVALLATSRLNHESIASAGMGVLFYINAVPVLCLAFVVWATAARYLAERPRRVAMVIIILLACGAWTLVRTSGVTGDFSPEYAWRWSATPEERLLVEASDEPMALSAPVAAVAGPDWPGFRGPLRDGIVRGVRIETDWSVSPPVELWRRPVGPGWSSFAVHGELFYTQEQRGEDELVSCYRLTTGEPVWRHRDEARFWESNAGAGPRATPTLSNGHVYTFGATGVLNALDAGDGAVVWSRNVVSDTDVEVPYWGFSGSPLVVGDVVIVAAAGTLVAYDLAAGDPHWFGPAGGASYSSPHLLTLDGATQVLMLNGAGTASFAPADGSLLWEHPWPGGPIVQPALTEDGDILISAGERSGIRRIGVVRGAGGWTIEERWTSVRLKPSFNDLVVHQGHAYGFDGRILTCIDLESGERRWRGGRYGNGQLVLLADQDLLLVLSEKGELALVAATPDQATELARCPAIEGKTWNHPVLVGDLLLVRNSQEMAAFRLSHAQA